MWPSLLATLKADLYRNDGRKGLPAFVRTVVTSPGYRYLVLLRICKAIRPNRLIRYSLYPFVLFWFARLGMKIGLRIPISCDIGDGLLIEHWGGVWVNPSAKMGKNVNISHGVTLGWVGHGVNRGAPIIGDHVFLGPGCTVLGKVTVGNHALVSANTVVLQDVPEEGVVIGVPGRVFSRQGSHEIIKFPYLPEAPRA
jgi:serine O-acetyltransferase